MKPLLTVCFFALIAAALYSEDCQSARYSRLYGGAQSYYYHLRIENGPGIPATATPNPFTGCLSGFILGYEYKNPNSLYTLLQISYALGAVKSTDAGNNERFIHDEILDWRVGYCRKFAKAGTWFLTPYTGTGFRWNVQYRRPEALSGLKFDYYKIYIPLGLAINYAPNKLVNLGIDFEWMPDVLSMVSISNLTGSFWELERMNNYLVQIPCIFTFANRYELSVIPFWMQFRDGKSIAVTDLGLALDLEQQMTNDWGGRIAFGVRF